VLSGFLIGGILIDNKGASNYFKTFYTRRVFRIFPLYFLILAIFAALVYIAPDLGKTYPYKSLFKDTIPLWSYPLFVQNFFMLVEKSLGAHWLSVTWSLAIEEQFYLVLPFLIFITPLRKLPFLLVFLIVLAPLIRLAFYFRHLNDAFFYDFFLMPCRMDSLMLGVLCAWLIRNQRTKLFLVKRLNGIYWLMAFLFLVLISHILFYPMTSFEDFHMFLYGFSVIALFYSCLLLVTILDNGGPLNKLVRLPFLKRLGVISYGVYMYHAIIIGLLHAWILNQTPRIANGIDAAVTASAFFLTLLVANLSWEVFEKRFVNLGRSFKYDTQATREMPVP